MNYYNTHAIEYIHSTLYVDMSDLYELVLPALKPRSKIMDLGFGSGRDAIWFADQGYDVVAVDASPKMCELLAEKVDIEIRNLRAEELRFENEFDLIWACASLLHVKNEDMPVVWKNLARALKDSGQIFVSLKKGDFEGYRNGRWFVDYTLEKIEKSGYRDAGLVLMHESESRDKRKGREQEKWLNLVFGKF